jgi:pimeloyl-ACP methyl ester carboxylesterase
MAHGPSEALRAWRDAGKRFSFQGHDVFYRDEGSGPPLLCVHGFPTASWDWHAVWPALVERHRVIAPDMLGFGFSAKPKAHRYSILEQATLHEELLRALDIGRARILAHDYGDTVAQELLARFEDRRQGSEPGFEIESICFLNGGLFPESHRARFVQKLLAGPLGPLISRLMSERRFASGFSAIFGPETRPSEQELADFWTLVRHDGGTRVAHRLIGYMEERRAHRARWVGALQKTRVPLRLVDGPEDPVSGAHMANRYRELVSDPDVVLLPGIGHYPQVEAPEAVVRELFAFHARLGRA